jgi:hypothetical protein
VILALSKLQTRILISSPTPRPPQTSRRSNSELVPIISARNSRSTAALSLATRTFSASQTDFCTIKMAFHMVLLELSVSKPSLSADMISYLDMRKRINSMSSSSI